MPAVPQNIISDVTELILNHIRQTSQELQVAPHPDKNHQSQLRAIEEKLNIMEETLTGVQASLSTRIVQRKRHWNSLTRFNQLPLEIASQILWLSVVDPWPQEDSATFLRRRKTISRVCSSWRILVEDSPRFWSIIEFSYLIPAISHLLEKSQSSGLEIRSFRENKYGYTPIDLSESKQRQCFIWIAPHTHRIRSLILSLRSTDGLGMVLEKPAPMLEELKLDLAPFTFHNVQAFDLFCGQASRLRDVALQNIAVSWDSDVLVGLRSLSIVEELRYLPTEGQVRRLLEANPELETLNIAAQGGPYMEHFGDDAVQPTGQEKPRRVVMSKMKELRLFLLPFKLVQAVLSNVEIPSISHLELRCVFRGIPASRLLGPNIIHLVPPLIRLSKGTQRAELMFGELGVSLAIYTPCHESPAVEIDLVDALPISGFDLLADIFFHAEGLPSVCAAEIFQVSLLFGDGFELAGGTFIPIFDRLNAVKVKTLTITRWCQHGEELIKYLGEVKGDSQWPLPYLTSMTIGGPAELADYLSIALQRRMRCAPAKQTTKSSQPVMLDVLDIKDLDGADQDVEKALAKCVAPRGTFIPGSRRLERGISGGSDSDSEDI